VNGVTGREPRSQPAARPCCRLSDFRPPQLSNLSPPLTLARHRLARFLAWGLCPRTPFSLTRSARLSNQAPRQASAPFARTCRAEARRREGGLARHRLARFLAWELGTSAAPLDSVRGALSGPKSRGSLARASESYSQVIWPRCRLDEQMNCGVHEPRARPLSGRSSQRSKSDAFRRRIQWPFTTWRSSAPM
jgi:hypothetical protein